jgi:4-alpha-glucanotransferase
VEKDFCRRYLACDSSGIPWEMIRAVWQSSARMAIAPLQDFMSLDTSARMNYPGRLGGNWRWRMVSNELSDELIRRTREINWLYNRLPELQKKKRKGY